MEKAGLSKKSKEIINYLLLGKGRPSTEEEDIKGKLGWDRQNQSTFANFAAQECDQMILNARWNQKNHFRVLTVKSFTDYGVCCRIFPWLDFENKLTKNKPRRLYTTDEFWSIPAGAKNGIKNGLDLLLDVESHEYSFFPRSSKGRDHKKIWKIKTFAIRRQPHRALELGG